MNFHARVVLISCLFTSIVYGQQRFFLDTSHFIIRDSEDLNLEHALFDHHHYYASSCEEWPRLNLQVTPFYTHLNAMESSEFKEANPTEIHNTEASTKIGGAHFQGQLNICNFYLRANMIVANIKTNYDTSYPDYPQSNYAHYSFTGVDDITIKAGYDWFFCNDKHHTGIYVLAGLPTNNRDAITATGIDTYKAKALDDRLGVYSYRIGGGLNTACTIYNCGDNHITWHADAQYAYGIPKTEATITISPDAITKIRYTPGNFISGWTAFHYAYCAWGFEFGSMFETMFGEKTSIKNKGTATTTLADLNLLEKPGQTIAFLAKPYFAVAYNTTICQNPFMIGFGVGYEYDKVHNIQLPATATKEIKVIRKYNAYEGVNVWGNLTYSF